MATRKKTIKKEDSITDKVVSETVLEKKVKSDSKKRPSKKDVLSKPVSESKKLAQPKTKKSKGHSKPLIETKSVAESELLAHRIAQLSLQKKAKDIALLDVREISGITDFFVLCTADSDRQVKAIAQEIEAGLKEEEESQRPMQVEAKEPTWIVMDYFDVIVHIFIKEKREFYSLEKLWGDALVTRLEDDTVSKVQQTKRKKK